MLTFALVTEGVTDQKVIENILYGYFGYDIDVNPLQPLYDEVDASRIGYHGGWEHVLDYCSSEDFEMGMIANDFMVIQIDTDQCHQARFGVPKTVGNAPFDLQDFIERVRERLVSEIDAELYAHDSPRILFAICVHSTECWLLPIYEPHKKQAAALDNCLFKLNKLLAKQNKPTLTKQPALYDAASGTYLKRKKLMSLAPKNPSLHLFVEALGTIEIAEA